MKRIILSTLFFIVMLTGAFAQKKESKETEYASFEAMEVAGVAVVYFTQEDRTSMSTEISGKPFPEVIKVVEDGVMKISTEGEAHSEIVKIYLSNPKLKSIRVSEAAEFYTVNTLKTDNLEVTVDKVGVAELTVDVEDLSINMNGGDLKIEGNTKKQVVNRSKFSERGSLDMKMLNVGR